MSSKLVSSPVDVRIHIRSDTRDYGYLDDPEVRSTPVASGSLEAAAALAEGTTGVRLVVRAQSPVWRVWLGLERGTDVVDLEPIVRGALPSIEERWGSLLVTQGGDEPSALVALLEDGQLIVDLESRECAELFRAGGELRLELEPLELDAKTLGAQLGGVVRQRVSSVLRHVEAEKRRQDRLIDLWHIRTEERLRATEARLRAAEERLDQVRSALARRLRDAGLSERPDGTVRPLVARFIGHRATHHDDAWLAETLSDDDRNAIAARIASMASPPTISVVMPVCDPPVEFLEEAIDSVLSQLYPYWELCLADDASEDPAVIRVLDAATSRDPRIRLVRRSERGHITRASNSALEVATGDWVTFLDHDDALTEHALFLVADAITRHPGVQLIYTDEDKLDEQGRRCEPAYKPGWSPDQLLWANYVAHLVAYTRERVWALGGFREGTEGAQDWDLLLRYSRGLRREEVVHIPAITYHWRRHAASTSATIDAKPYAIEAQRAVLNDALAPEGGYVTPSPHPDMWWPHFTLRGRPSVAIVVPTRDGGTMLAECIDSVLATDYDNFTVEIIDNGSVEPTTLELLDHLSRDARVHIHRYPYPFNYARMHNEVVRRLQAEFLVLLNDDTRIMSSDWLRELLAFAQREGVGCVGPMLVNEDGDIISAGSVLDGTGSSHITFSAHEKRSNPLATAVRNPSAVTAACLLVRRAVWCAAGGMDPRLAVAFNDVDLGLRMGELGLRNVVVPSVTVLHREGASRGKDTARLSRAAAYAAEALTFGSRWPYVVAQDPQAPAYLGRDDRRRETGRSTAPLGDRQLDLGRWRRFGRVIGALELHGGDTIETRLLPGVKEVRGAYVIREIAVACEGWSPSARVVGTLIDASGAQRLETVAPDLARGQLVFSLRHLNAQFSPGAQLVVTVLGGADSWIRLPQHLAPGIEPSDGESGGLPWLLDVVTSVSPELVIAPRSQEST